MSITPSLESERSNFLRDSLQDMDWVDLQFVLCVSLGNWYCSPRSSFLCLLSILKQGHHPHTLKASRLGIICLQSNLGIQKPKLGPLGACKILLGTVWCLSIRFLCSLKNVARKAGCGQTAEGVLALTFGILSLRAVMFGQ